MSRNVSAKDQAGHTSLKFRQVGQSSAEEMATTNFREELKSKEEKALIENSKNKYGAAAPATAPKVDSSIKLLKNDAEIDLAAIAQKYDDADAEDAKSKSDFDSSSR